MKVLARKSNVLDILLLFLLIIHSRSSCFYGEDKEGGYNLLYCFGLLCFLKNTYRVTLLTITCMVSTLIIRFLL